MKVNDLLRTERYTGRILEFGDRSWGCAQAILLLTSSGEQWVYADEIEE